MIPVLDEHHYLQFVGAPEDRGWNSTTHLAMVDFGDGKTSRAYVKLPFDAYPAIANEALGWMLTRALKLRTPPRTAVMLMPASRFAAEIGPIPDYAEGRDTLALWCSEALPFKSLRFLFRSDVEVNRALEKLLHTKDGRRIAAMACFTGHIDTNPGNLLHASGGEYVSIDHEHLFLASDWRKGPPHPCADTYLLQWLSDRVKKHAIRPDTMRTICSEMALHGEQHGRALGMIHPYASELLADLTDFASTSRVLLFLADRSWCSWLYERLGVLEI